MSFTQKIVADSIIDRYYFYIIEGKKSSRFYLRNTPPVIQKINRKNPHHPKNADRNKSEGPYNTLMELKENSLFFNAIEKPSIKEKICKKENIVEIFDCEAIDKDGSIETPFHEAIRNATINKFESHKSKGIKFYTQDKERVLEVISEDEKTGIYLAQIEKLNKETESWIPKEGYSTFFPDKWSIKILFYECEHAFKNKRHIAGKKFIGKSHKGIQVCFIINDDDQIYSCYPIFDDE